MNKFTRAQVECPGVSLATALDCMKPKGGGSGEQSSSNEPPKHLSGAYKEYGTALTGTGSRPATPGRWENVGGGSDDYDRGVGWAGSNSGGERRWVPGQEAVEGTGGFMQEYNPTWYEGQIQADVPD